MERNKAIDAFRGLAIIGMVFFSLTLKLSKNLPEPLKHNARGILHLGDLVLPMFIFASGLSLAYLIKKLELMKEEEYYSRIISRFLLLAMIGIGLSYFSAFGFLQMDEVMLIALLFILCLVLSRLHWTIAMGIILVINFSYLIFLYYGLDGVFLQHYLGGYYAIIFYLPVMLTGLYLGEGIIKDKLWCKDNLIILSLIMVFFVITLFLYPIDKLAATPTFMMLSIIFSVLVFTITNIILKKVKNIEPLEYIGRKPLRYWLMMYLFFMIPVILYSEHYNVPLPFEIDWGLGIVIALIFMVLIAICSILIDRYIPIKFRDLINS